MRKGLFLINKKPLKAKTFSGLVEISGFEPLTS